MNNLLFTYLQLEFKFIIRNRRPRLLLFLSLLIMVAFPAICTSSIFLDSNSYYLLVAFLFSTSPLMLAYASFLIAWESSYFSFIMTQPINFQTYIESKFYVFLISSIICTSISLCYSIYSLKVVYLCLSCFLYNIGVNSHLFLFFAKYNTDYIDLYEGAYLGEGIKGAQIIAILPTFVLPTIIYSFIILYFDFITSMIAISILGLVGLLIHGQLMRKITNAILREKYNLHLSYKKV